MVRFLEWDSEFFQLRIGAADVVHVSEVKMQELEGFDLVYFFSQTKNEYPANTYFFADEKITYIKKIQDSPINMEENVHSLFSVDINTNLIDLAYQAGSYSRFKIDSKFPSGSFEKLYKQWIINSVSRLIAEEVYVFKSSRNCYDGLITVGIKNDIPDIGIIAVDESSRGKGIGKKLLNAAESWAKYEKHTNEIQVVTQGFNKQACSFYERNGFKISSRIYVYHWWAPISKR